ncbi:ABC transporter ATP-binding protein [Paenibacillus alkalitolerans]|uniref:ABC transporter ATP-binding protein n=1 Tax=Paenibacillus alkalitolerans TaxID=2799335 RepID=UPI0018F7399D|nr:ABC transporter ATP-binding protein [Paenibacillus alkalitolerans]
MNENAEAKQPPLLEVRDLKAGFEIGGRLRLAVDGVSFKAGRGKIVCVVGESGCGKSVMSLSIMKLLPKGIGRIAGGEIILEGRNIASFSEEEMNKIRGKDAAMIFQEPMTALNPVFSVGFQVEEVLFNHTKISRKHAREKSAELLMQVGISAPEKVLDQYPHQLSGGMRQRVMIAMAIACYPKLLIADEPTTALDVTIQAQILELIKDIQYKRDMSVLLITHDLGVVAEMADDVIVMYAGQIVEQGGAEELFYNPKHPYLKALLKSIPRLGEKKKRLDSIKGIVPSLANMPREGCRFADRCPEATGDCRKIAPQLANIADGHTVRCLLYKESIPAVSEGVK